MGQNIPVKDNHIENSKTNSAIQTVNHDKIFIAAILIIIVALLVFMVIFFFPGPLSNKFQSFSGYDCLSDADNFTCSLNLSYSSTGQISLNVTQKANKYGIYNVTFFCLGNNASSLAKPSGILNTTNNAMPYGIPVHVSDIQCYNSTGPVHVGPSTTFYGTLYVNFTTNNGSSDSGWVGTIEIGNQYK